jgi:hypothetical protein
MLYYLPQSLIFQCTNFSLFVFLSQPTTIAHFTYNITLQIRMRLNFYYLDLLLNGLTSMLKIFSHIEPSCCPHCFRFRITSSHTTIDSCLNITRLRYSFVLIDHFSVILVLIYKDDLVIRKLTLWLFRQITLVFVFFRLLIDL